MEDLPNAPAISDDVRRLASEDPLMSVPPRLLAAIDKAKLDRRVRQALLDVTRIAIWGHPVMDLSPPPDEAINSHAELVHDYVATIAGLVSRVSMSDPPVALRRQADIEDLRRNLVTSVALYLAVKYLWPVERLVTVLSEHVWLTATEPKRLSSERALLSNTDLVPEFAVVSLGWQSLVRAADRQLAEASVREESLNRSHAQLLADKQALATEAEALRDEISARDARLAESQRLLQTEREARRIERSHAVDDFETLRTLSTRSLGDQLKLLEDGLHALRHDRSLVTDEYLERAIEGLQKLLLRIKAASTEEESAR